MTHRTPLKCRMCTDMCMDMCVDMCMDMCVGMCMDMCVDMYIGSAGEYTHEVLSYLHRVV